MNASWKFVLTLVGFGCVNQAGAFGDDGHRTIGAIADLTLKGTKAEAHVQAILGPNRNLSAVSVWADCAKGYCGPLTPEMQAFVQANPQHANYHFADVPFQWPSYETSPVGTRPDDIVHILQQCIRVLKGDQSDNPHHFTDVQALLLVAHLVGDLHQPLHVGAAYLNDHSVAVVPSPADLTSQLDREDLGGNWLVYGANNLHHYWDIEFVAAGMGRTGATTPLAYAQALVGSHVAPSTPAGDVVGWPVQWANETLAYSKMAHSGMSLKALPPPKPGQVLWQANFPPEYATAAEQVDELAVANGGYRLAQLLATIWPQ